MNRRLAVIPFRDAEGKLLGEFAAAQEHCSETFLDQQLHASQYTTGANRSPVDGQIAGGSRKACDSGRQ